MEVDVGLNLEFGSCWAALDPRDDTRASSYRIKIPKTKCDILSLLSVFAGFINFDLILSKLNLAGASKSTCNVVLKILSPFCPIR